MKAILWDADGVLLKKQGYFSEHYAKENGVPYEEVMPFYTGPFQSCLTGRADLVESIAPWLPKWNWEKPAEDFLRLWFSSDAHVDEQVLSELKSVRERGMLCYMASNQEKHRAAYLMDELGLRAHFDGAFFSHALGVQKTDPSFFTQVIAEISVPASEITYFDDDQANVDSAKSVGIDAHFYGSISDLAPIRS